MKRILAVIVLVMMLCSCSVQTENIRPEHEEDKEFVYENKEKYEFKGIWIAMYELVPDSSNEDEYIKKTEAMMENISEFGFTDVFVQVRANCDAIYPSEIFPASVMFSDDGKLFFDAFEIICEKVHKVGLKVHAWINPYRICTDVGRQPLNLPSGINEKMIFKNGAARYLNPCDQLTRKQVLGGIREIIENYDVDGVHIDDYFYPTQGEKIDKKQFTAYKKSGGQSSLEDFRRSNVSLLISSIYSLIKDKNENMIFSISPSADIEKNRDVLYADTELWCREEGYCDMIIPQIYFGFENASLPFKETYDRWRELTENGKVKLCIGLAIYKSGCDDKYAGESGRDEWKENSDIIKRQLIYIRENGADGFCVFSYNYIFGNKNLTFEEVKNLKSVI